MGGSNDSNLSIRRWRVLSLLSLKYILWSEYSIEEGFTQKPRQTVVVAFLEKMAPTKIVQHELIKAGRASNVCFVETGSISTILYCLV